MEGKQPETIIICKPMTDIMPHFLPDEVLGYCSRCPGYGKRWSCPPHAVPPEEYLEQFDSICLMATKIYRADGASQEEQLADYQKKKRQINEILLAREHLFPGGQILIAGHCEWCPDCTREQNLPCRKPEKLRHSPESLGFKISSILSDLFSDGLQWQGTGTPSYLYVVTGLLSKGEADIKKLHQLFR